MPHAETLLDRRAGRLSLRAAATNASGGCQQFSRTAHHQGGSPCRGAHSRKAMIAPSRFQPLSQLDDASNSQPAEPTIQGSSPSRLQSDILPNGPTTAENQVILRLFAERHAASEHTAMDGKESWTVVQNRTLQQPKPPTSPQCQTLIGTIMLRPKVFTITQIPPHQYAYRLRLSLPQIKGSDIHCRLLTKSNLAVVDFYTEQAAHLLLNLEHLVIDDKILQFNTYVALREVRIRDAIHRIKGLTEEQKSTGGHLCSGADQQRALPRRGGLVAKVLGY
ncbi:hypothetical protein HPB51_008908 [Rhipicephalus microplus]|uniref:Uncharacterized protein n=1 Tax=Rhipicephalus microplus TaxID=6941 RepID=A0A9J6DLG5_RHIMP|nr:hypothetical protein HPB51_008908 [Rhipicephalus microplus]